LQDLSDPKDDALYDDFLDGLHHAATKALAQQRTIPAYQEFLKFLKRGADEAGSEARGGPTGVRLPSYDDFVESLQRNSAEPVQTYKDFLVTLKAGAEKAMNMRENKGVLGGPFDKIEEAMGMESKEEREHRKLREEFKRLKAEEKKAKHLPRHVKKPLMTRINVLRTELCWKRPNLMEHEKCLEFLGIKCMKESTGEGICKKFEKKMRDACASAQDPEWKETYCIISEALDESEGIEEEKEKDEHSEEAEAIAGHEGDEEEFVDDDDEIDDDLLADDFSHGGSPAPAPASGVKAGAAGSPAAAVAGGPAGANGAPAPAAVSDRDGDGVPDNEDAFADDPSESKDTDGDGIGDNADTDLDGDGYDNAVDVFPHDPKEWKDTDHDGIGDNSDDDVDSDGTVNKEDAFPNDPTEWKDSDGDGVGDNKDAYPFNAKCHDPHKECIDVKAHKLPAPGSPEDPATNMDMNALKPLPSQGFSEESTEGPHVKHNNFYTWVGDWQDEFPADEEMTEEQTMREICKDNPTNIWCRKYLEGK
jgi:hypothetical protein